MYADGIRVSTVAETLGVSNYIVKNSVVRMLQTGGMADRPRSGKTTRLSSRSRRLVKYSAMRGLYCSANTLASDMGRIYKVRISGRHTRRALRAYGFHRYADKLGPRITPKWRRARREFYRTNLATDWKHVVFTDEKVFAQESNGRIKYYARSFEEYQEKHHTLPFGHAARIKVWGAISDYGVGPLILVDSHMTTADYVRDVLQPAIGNRRQRAGLLGRRGGSVRDFIWQQDNAPCHHGPAARHFFESRNIHVMKWPAYSPDLSPIENIWNILQYRLRVQQTTTGTVYNNETLFRAVQEAWNSITQEECRAIIRSMPDRLNELFRRNYNIIDY